ncbi:hypothetical protein F5888DRAFT_1911735, partial [Russula emetica]
MSARSDPDQCALDENGQLKDANNIRWFNSPSDKTPIPLLPVEGVEGETVTDVGAPHTRPQQNELGESAGCAESGPSGLGRIQRSGRGRKMAEALEYEKADNDGNPIKRLTTLTVRPPRKSRQVKKQHIDTTDMGASSDEDDCDYQDTEPAELESESSSPSEGDCQDTLPSNAEVADILPSKTIPTGRGTSGKRTRTKPTPSFGEIQPISRAESMCSNSDTREKTPKPMVTRNPIYHFYEAVERSSNGELRNPGDRHYKCLHGNGKVLTITKKMKYSLNGLIGHLRSVSAPMYRLYVAMKEQSPDQITAD